MERSIGIGDKRWLIHGNDADNYLTNLTDPFEPHLVSMLAAFCDNGARALDIGANIGCTALALSEIVGSGKVVAFEPVPRTFANLVKNVGGVDNITTHHFALGKEAGVLPMQGAEGDSSGAFVANQFHIANTGYFQVNVPVRTLDEAFPSLGLDRVDFIKIDVEGFELDVFEGAAETLRRFKPRVVLEMNHFCLNMFRRMTYPEFRERLLRIFPCIFAIDGARYVDLTSESDAYSVGYEHIVMFRFPNLVAGFDRDDLISRISVLQRSLQKQADDARVAAEAEVIRQQSEAESLRAERDALQRERDNLESALADCVTRAKQLEIEKHALLDSTSWRVTQPLRSLKKLFTKKAPDFTGPGLSR
ncbi:FkbM family methyltransferase [Burkholderia multivorans]|uniref:Methyltransferase FkbM domain-containing protein n=1 Tax=Burkholderia multivorans TaxID=87883 RepID=A0A8E2RU19_9BURK|nr:FkbM family methyltransferase [Burkholderia multivorans]MDN8088817.1 FkbM family methyltransferase [Burkholderia multivorans]MDN8094599.1 FkbM family methyltransferase [Burkholderia multivorans]MDN8107682.1 FkbM family methyltransferase [Burkholderia multivorans]MDN8125030.1 FkbM family methyltransferase [Burkholderia multivorans]MDN8130811.1 FkbM family methyltransferase [Burkholderia multivorans]